MAEHLPEKYADLLQKRAFANLGTLNGDGSPQVTPVWVDYDGKYVRINSARGRVKDKNIRRDPRVSLSIQRRRAPTSTSTVWPRNIWARTSIPDGSLARRECCTRSSRRNSARWDDVNELLHGLSTKRT